MPLESLERWIGYANVALQAFLAWKIVRDGMRKPLLWFHCWLIFEVVRSLISLPLSFESNAYAYFFCACLPLAWMLYVLMTMEVYERVLSGYRGLAIQSRRTVFAVVALCTVGGIALVVPDLLRSGDPFPILVAVLSANRWVVNSVALLLLAQVAFLLWYPAPMKRNTTVHSLILTLYFLGESAGDLARNQLGPNVARLSSLAVVALGAIWTLGWVIFLKPSGERDTVAVRSGPPPEFESRVLKQLESLNTYLDRTVKK